MNRQCPRLHHPSCSRFDRRRVPQKSIDGQEADGSRTLEDVTLLETVKHPFLSGESP